MWDYFAVLIFKKTTSENLNIMTQEYEMSLHDIPALAMRQLQDYRDANLGTCFADPEFSININTAYHLQNAVTKLRVEDGENVIDYKVGCIGPTTTAQFGMDGPI